MPSQYSTSASCSPPSEIGLAIFACPVCHHRMQVPDDFPQTTAPCLNCGEAVTSPMPKGQLEAEQIKAKQQHVLTSSIRNVLIVALTGVSMVVLIILSYLNWAPTSSLPAINGKAPAVTEGEWNARQWREIDWEDEARACLIAFLSATSKEERSRYAQGEDLYFQEFKEGKNLAAIPVDAFFMPESVQRDRGRGIFSLQYRKPSGQRITEFRSIPPPEAYYTPLGELPFHLRGGGDSQQLLDEGTFISAHFKRHPDGLKLDWPTFAQAYYGRLEQFFTAASKSQKETFRVVLFKERVLPQLDPKGTLAGYRIAELSRPEESYRVLVDQPRIMDVLESRLENDFTKVETVTVSVVEKGGRFYLNDIYCWEFLGLGGEAGNLK